MAVTIRRAELTDLDALIALRVEVAREGIWIGAELPLDEERDRTRFATTIADGETAVMFVAEIDGEAVGNLDLVNPMGIAHLGMNVADGHRGQGVGAALMEAAVAWARSAGAHKMELDHWPWNHRARALYERFGFVEEGYRRRHWRRKDGSLWDAVTMGLVLDHESPGHDERASEPPR
ncbi:N-acetyltransferase family protein [Actinospongicola halichondriae]|uniref:GNAT family N-acetyltransferase n=1 Tax=Actinospongicola halichondriae TaxID=3236844 RepID=UPI003D5721C1